MQSLFFGWWLLENLLIHYLSFDFLLWATKSDAKKKLPLWLILNGLLSAAVLCFRLPYAFFLYLFFLFFAAKYFLKTSFSEMIPAALVLVLLSTLKESFSAFLLSWASRNMVSVTRGAAEQLFCSAWMALLFFLALRGIKKRCFETFRFAVPEYFYVLAIPCVWAAALIRAELRLDSMQFEQHLSSLPAGARLLLLFLLAGAAAVSFLGIGVFCKMTAFHKQAERKALLENQWKLQRAYVEETQRRNEQYASFQHDVDNHLLVLSGLIQEKRFAQAERYMEKLRTKSARFGKTVSTGNAALDVLLSQKMDAAKQQGITVSCAVRIPKSFRLDSTDLCALFANIWDNAITACQKEIPEKRVFSLSAKACSRFLLIEAANPASFLKTVQPGTGLRNIREIAEQYQGTMETVTENGNFRISVLLRCPEIDP